MSTTEQLNSLQKGLIELTKMVEEGFAATGRRFTALEEDRARETQKLDTMLAAIHELQIEMKEVKADIREIKQALKQLSYDVIRLRSTVDDHEERITLFERKPS